MMPELRPEAVAPVEKETFIKDEVTSKEHVFHEQIQEVKDRWNSYPSVIDELKDKVKSEVYGIYFYLIVITVPD